LSLAEQELTVQRWSILWRTITLSTFGNTIYPYCRHLRFLDLRDLGDLLDDDKFRGKIAKHFFSGDLAEFRCLQQVSVGKGRATRLDIKKIVAAIGGQITRNAPMLEALSEPTNSNIFSSALSSWVDRLTHLRSLDLWDGTALADETLRNLLHVHCPNLSSLRIYSSPNDDADHALATFIGGMQDNTLTYFENISNCRIGGETCLALNTHGKSLQTLKLALAEEGIQALALLQECTVVQDLAIAAFTRIPDLKATQHDIFLQITDWLKSCTGLQDISLTNLVSAPDLLLPVLLSKDISLRKLQINATESAMYVLKDHHSFHQAFSHQPGLRSLLLRADADLSTRDDQELLVSSLCSLKELRELRLTRITDYFTDAHIGLLAVNLPNLEDLYVGGYGVSDAVFLPLSELHHLKFVTFSGVTTFTEKGILEYINMLGENNRGLLLSIDNADPDRALSQESQDLIRDLIATKLDGRFEYQLLRGIFDHLGSGN
jgi:hypothetical protein